MRSQYPAYLLLLMRTIILLIKWMNKNSCPVVALQDLLPISNPFTALDFCLDMFFSFLKLNCLGCLVSIFLLVGTLEAKSYLNGIQSTNFLDSIHFTTLLFLWGPTFAILVILISCYSLFNPGFLKHCGI